MTDHYDAIIIGGGIVGLACAASLHRRGITNIKIYEKANALHPVGAAIGLFPNGFRALHEISPTVETKVQHSCIPNDRMILKDLEGNIVRDTLASTIKSSGQITPAYLVWYLLQQYLAEDLPEGVLTLGHVFESFHVEDDDIVKVRVSNRRNTSSTSSSSPGEIEEKTCRVLIGADGIRSTVRTQLFGKRDLKFHGKMMFRAVIELDQMDDPTICPPAGTSLGFQGDETGKLFSFRETAKGIMTFTSMAVFREPKWSGCDEEKRKRLKELFRDYPRDVQYVLDNVDASTIHEDAVQTIEVEDVWSKGNVVIVGDAAHAMTPGMGQGANQGLEDACELIYELAPILQNESSESISDALQHFWKKRVERVKKVHAVSGARTSQVNASNKNAPVNLSGNDPVFLDRLYGWKPSYL